MLPVACYCTQSRRAANLLTDIYDAALAPSGLRVTQFSLLRAVGRLDAPTLGSLAEATGLDRSTLGRNLRRMEADGLIRIAPGKDARTRVVLLTDAACAALDRAAPLWQATQERIARALPPESRADLAALAGRLAAVASEAPR